MIWGMVFPGVQGGDEGFGDLGDGCFWGPGLGIRDLVIWGIDVSGVQGGDEGFW